MEGVAISGPLETSSEIRVAMEHDWHSANIAGERQSSRERLACYRYFAMFYLQFRCCCCVGHSTMCSMSFSHSYLRELFTELFCTQYLLLLLSCMTNQNYPLTFMQYACCVHLTLFCSGLLDDPKEASAVKGILQAHLPTLDKIYASSRFVAADLRRKQTEDRAHAYLHLYIIFIGSSSSGSGSSRNTSSTVVAVVVEVLLLTVGLQ